jgi:hypothetical protein
VDHRHRRVIVPATHRFRAGGNAAVRARIGKVAAVSAAADRATLKRAQVPNALNGADAAVIVQEESVVSNDLCAILSDLLHVHLKAACVLTLAL